MTVTVAINGFGRIGRSILRAHLTTRLWPGIEIVSINDIAPRETCAYLFQYDSVFGPYPGKVSATADALVVDGRRIPFTLERDLGALDLSGVDVVLECTGIAGTRPVAEAGIRAGARRVLVSGPTGAADVTVVLGANEAALAPEHLIVSNASCTTNALAPLARLLDDAFGIETGDMTTIHCYTGSQPSVDQPTASLERSRAAALSMVPTSTSASKLVGEVLPHLRGRLEGSAVRVPVASVSAVDLKVMTRRAATVEAVNRLLKGAGGVIGCEDGPLVSTDLRQRPESIVMAPRETRLTDQGMLRVFGWYDNEWGFANRMLDVAALMGAQEGTGAAAARRERA